MIRTNSVYALLHRCGSQNSNVEPPRAFVLGFFQNTTLDSGAIWRCAHVVTGCLVE
jgi:hypothetical protein